MKKLTEKLKYKLVDGHAELFARHVETKVWTKVATCHLSAVDHIEKHGLKATMDLGCIRWCV